MGMFKFTIQINVTFNVMREHFLEKRIFFLFRGLYIYIYEKEAIHLVWSLFVG